MNKFTVRLESIADVKMFVNTACIQPFDIDMVSGRYIVDAKSIMGIFSLDLSKPIALEVHGTEEDGRMFYESVKQFAGTE
jgi:phosphotransferase system HPr-like phosphotransfer protein